MRRRYNLRVNVVFTNPESCEEWETTDSSRRIEIPEGYTKPEIQVFGDMLVATGLYQNYVITEWYS